MKINKGDRVRSKKTGMVGTVKHVGPTGLLARVRFDGETVPSECSPKTWQGSACFVKDLEVVR